MGQPLYQGIFLFYHLAGNWACVCALCATIAILNALPCPRQSPTEGNPPHARWLPLSPLSLNQIRFLYKPILMALHFV